MIPNDESPLPNTEVHHLESDQVGDEFKVILGHSGSSASGPRPVLFLGDPWANFGTAVETVRLLRLSGAFPDVVVVGVGYRSTEMERIGTLRTRDFTPTVDARRATEAVPTTMMGGADRFLAFLRDELKPWVRGRHGADPDDSMLFGHSYGGLFCTHVLLTDPTAFRRYGVGSPSLWWHDGVMFAREEEYAKANDDLPASAFFSVGGYETLEGRRHFLAQVSPDERARGEAEDAEDPPVDVVADMERLVARLRSRSYRSLTIESVVLPGEYHETSPPLNLSRAVRALFGSPR